MTATCEITLFEDLFDVQGYSITSSRKAFNATTQTHEVYLEIKPLTEASCPVCGRIGNKYRYDSSEQLFYLGSILCKPVYAILKVYRFNCPDCGILTEKQTISEGKCRYSKAVPAMVLQYTNLTDNSSVSTLLCLSKSTVYRIDYTELTRLLDNYKDKIPSLSSIAVDEVAHKTGHNYATIITNQKDGKVVWVEKDRFTHSLESAYQRYPDRFNSVEVATMDFWRPYESATHNCLPGCRIVYDRFHLSRILNKALEEERRAYQNELPKDERKYIKKHTRWILLRRHHNCTSYHKDRLEELKEHNKRLYELYLLKEDFLSIFDEDTLTKEHARQLIIAWTNLVMNKPFEHLKRFAKNLLDRLDKVLSWFDHRISNGKAEGINNVIKTILKRGYGYSDFHYFRLKILQRCGYLMNANAHTF